MPKPLRYTGDWPPPDILRQYPNWTYALDEEGAEGQDETTLKPDYEQTWISSTAVFTAGEALLADGRSFPAIISIGKSGIDSVDVFESSDPWRVLFDYPSQSWVAFIQTWLPEVERMPVVDMSDKRVFPLCIKTCLPRQRGGEPLKIEILPDGSSRDFN